MGKTIDVLMQEADEIISKKFTKAASVSSNEVSKLADQLKNSSPVTELTLTEKVANAIAIADTLINLDYLMKVSELEKKASEAGLPEEEVNRFFEKNASSKFKSVFDLINI